MIGHLNIDWIWQTILVMGIAVALWDLFLTNRSTPRAARPHSSLETRNSEFPPTDPFGRTNPPHPNIELGLPVPTKTADEIMRDWAAGDSSLEPRNS